MHSPLKITAASVAAILATTISFAIAAPEDEKETRPAVRQREMAGENTPSPRADRPERGPERPVGPRKEEGQRRSAPPRDRPTPPQKSPEPPREAGHHDREPRPEPGRSPEERLRHLREAGEHLALAGFPEESRHVREIIERVEQELRDRKRGDERPDELARQVNELRERVRMLHEEVIQLKKDNQEHPPHRE